MAGSAAIPEYRDHSRVTAGFAVELARKAGELGSRYFREIETLTIESKGHIAAAEPESAPHIA